MLLEHLGEPAAAGRVMRAIERVTADPALHTRDLGGTATTAQVTEAVCAEMTKPELAPAKRLRELAAGI
jgi:tartrate dehydrogenase/decarboxylase/D-malate dehydrogenase